MGVAACSEEPEIPDFTDAEMAKIKMLGPLPAAPPPDPTNKYAENPAAAALGQKLFFDKAFSDNVATTIPDDGMNGGLGAVGTKSTTACITCHDPANWFIDTRSKPGNVSLGATAYLTRNALSLVNSSYYTWNGWAGRQDSVWLQTFGTSQLFFAHTLYKKYKDEYNAIFPVPLDPALDPAAPDAARFPLDANPGDMSMAWEMMAPADQEIIMTIAANGYKATGAYVRKLISTNAPIDKYINGDKTALSAAAKRGLGLFIGKAGCDNCHSGPFFTDQQFHCTGVPQTGDHVPMMDMGRINAFKALLKDPFSGIGKYSDDVTYGTDKVNKAGGMPAMTDTGLFRTKGLRTVKFTGPYLHTGNLTTIEEVVDFYNRGGETTGFQGTKDPKMVPLNLTPAEQADLVTFLKEGLVGDPIPAELQMDTHNL